MSTATEARTTEPSIDRRDKVRRYRSNLRAHPETKTCECGNQAEVYVCGDCICGRCYRLQLEQRFEKPPPAVEPDHLPFWVVWCKRRQFKVTCEPEKVQPGPAGLVIVGQGVYAL